MSHISRYIRWLTVFALVVGSCGRALAIDPFEVPSRDVPPRELPQVDRWNRGPIGGEDDASSQAIEAAGPVATPLRTFPVRFQPAETQATAQRNIEPEPKTLKLTPRSSDSHSDVRTGEIPSLTTGAASLGIVLGLFLLVILVMRRGMPKHATLLPREAVEVLGRAPLVGKQQVHLVRCGNKILLLCASNTSVTTLTEITDRAEVDRISEICQPAHGASLRFARSFNSSTRSRTRWPIRRDNSKKSWTSAAWTPWGSTWLENRRFDMRASKIMSWNHPTTRLGWAMPIGLALALLALEPRLAVAQEAVSAIAEAVSEIANEPAAESLGETVGEASRLTLPGGLGSPEQWTSPEGLASTLQVMLLLTVISLAPAILMMTTCFVRIVVVLGLLRQALGTQQLPPSQVITSIALFMTLLIMWPAWSKVYTDAIKPYSEREITLDEAWDAGVKPVRQFMSAQIARTGNSNDVWLFCKYLPADTPAPSSYEDVPLVALLPAFMLSELKTSFLIGFQIYLPFLVLDLVIASVTISMGMLMLPPVLISLPFKLLLFVLVDGWHLVVGMLMDSFQPYS